VSVQDVRCRPDMRQEGTHRAASTDPNAPARTSASSVGLEHVAAFGEPSEQAAHGSPLRQVGGAVRVDLMAVRWSAVAPGTA
jgi:hypothetical protein